jgi:hypothetical protein
VHGNEGSPGSRANQLLPIVDWAQAAWTEAAHMLLMQGERPSVAKEGDWAGEDHYPQPHSYCSGWCKWPGALMAPSRLVVHVLQQALFAVGRLPGPEVGCLAGLASVSASTAGIWQGATSSVPDLPQSARCHCSRSSTMPLLWLLPAKPASGSQNG